MSKKIRIAGRNPHNEQPPARAACRTAPLKSSPLRALRLPPGTIAAHHRNSCAESPIDPLNIPKLSRSPGLAPTKLNAK